MEVHQLPSSVHDPVFQGPQKLNLMDDDIENTTLNPKTCATLEQQPANTQAGSNALDIPFTLQ